MTHQLKFEKPQRLYQAVGVLKDDQGNAFRVFLTGPKQASLTKFIAYQNRKKRQPEGSGITVTIEQASEPGEVAEPSSLPSASQRALARRITTAVKKSCLEVRISRLKLEPDQARPHRVRYTLDPRLDRKEGVSTPLNNQRTADILCTASQGSVRVVLYEIDQENHEIPRNDAIAGPGNPVEFHQPRDASIGNGNWKAYFIGIDLVNQFTAVLGVRLL